jgi:pimeloyl-ACP methyl ester carboxylesterase
MAYFNFQNHRVFYKTPGKGDPLLLIHGNSVSSRMFNSILKLYTNSFKVILFDFPGHGKSTRLEKLNTDFWYYNATVANALLNKLKLEKVAVIGTSGGALVGLNLALEHPEKVKFLVADSFEGGYPLESYIKTIREDRERDKKFGEAQLFWKLMHGEDWENVVDMDTEVNIEFAKTGKSFFHKSISELNVPTLLTGSKKDEYCHNLDEIYSDLKMKNPKLDVHLFNYGNHPAMLSNKNEFFELFRKQLKME